MVCRASTKIGRPYPSFDDLAILPAQVSGKIPIDPYRDDIHTGVKIGEDKVKKPLVLRTPIFVVSGSYGEISKPCKMAYAYGTAIAGAAILSGDGGLTAEELDILNRHGGKLIYQWTPGRFGLNLATMRDADAIVIELGIGTGAFGKFLLADKLTSALATTHALPENVDIIGHGYFPDLANAEDLRKHVELVREITRYRIPVIVKLSAGAVYEELRASIESAADAVMICGREVRQLGSATSVAGVRANQNIGLPVLGIFSPALKAIRDTMGTNKSIKLIVAGGISTGADIYKALALGVDAIGIDTVLHPYVGCTGCNKCYTGKCSQGIATHVPELESKLDWRSVGDSIAKFIAILTEELRVLTALSGYSDISQIDDNNLRALNYDAAVLTGIKLIGYDKPLPLWEH